MARPTKLSLLLILNYTTRLISHSLATVPHLANNATNADDDRTTVCRDTDIWIQPPLPSPSWGPQEVYLLCQILINDMYHTQPEIYTPDPPLHEFYPRGTVPAYPDLTNPVQTPWRFTRGKNKYFSNGGIFPAFPRSCCCCCCCCCCGPIHFAFGSDMMETKLIDCTGLFLALIGQCTLAVTTLDSVPLGYLPAEIRAMGPFPRRGTSWWWNIWNDALKHVLVQCVSQGKAGMTWDSEFALLTYLPACIPACLLLATYGWLLLLLRAYEVVLGRRPALGIFMFATGSGIDRALGESPADTVMGMGGVNGSVDAAIMMTGTRDAVMEDVETAKSRRWVRKGLGS